VSHTVARGTARCLRACLRCVTAVICGFPGVPASPPDAGYHIWHDTGRAREMSKLSMKCGFRRLSDAG
jgi:hypothetical protein